MLEFHPDRYVAVYLSVWMYGSYTLGTDLTSLE